MRRRAERLGRAIAALVIMGGVVQLSACGCDSDTSDSLWDAVSIEELSQDADVVFIGTPVHKNASAFTSRTEYVAEVDTVFRGELPSEVLVVVDAPGGCGGVSLELDQEMVVFGTLDGDDGVRLVARRTGVSDQEVAAVLGDGRSTTEQVELPRPEGLRLSRFFGSTALLYAGLGLGGIAVFSLVGKWASAPRD